MLTIEPLASFSDSDLTVMSWGMRAEAASGKVLFIFSFVRTHPPASLSILSPFPKSPCKFLHPCCLSRFLPIGLWYYRRHCPVDGVLGTQASCHSCSGPVSSGNVRNGVQLLVVEVERIFVRELVWLRFSTDGCSKMASRPFFRLVPFWKC